MGLKYFPTTGTPEGIQRIRPKPLMFVIIIVAELLLVAAVMRPAWVSAETFDVYLEGFTDNTATENISTILMYVEFDSPGMELEGCTIAGAAAGWWAGTGMCSMDGPFVILTAFDHQGGISLTDGRLFTITSNMPALSIDRIYFWNEGEVGYQYPNLYPDSIQLIDFTAHSATFSADLTPIDPALWGAVKSLYR